MRRWYAALILLCPSVASAYGEPANLEQHLEERDLHFHTDRLRVDPGATDVQFDTYDPVRPLVYNDDLHEAARFYADDMAENGCFPANHSSCDGTSFGDRVRSFYDGPSIAENIAKGQTSGESAVFDSWLYSPGHRENMLNDEWNELGAGFAVEGSTPLWVQDFGRRSGIEEPVVTSSTHAPLRPSIESDTRFFAATYDPAGVDLSDMNLVVTNACFDMEVDRGANGMTTWTAVAETGPEGCMPYWFWGTTDAGDIVAYPTEGSLLAPVGGADCPTWTAERRKADCAPADLPGFDGSGQGCASGGEEAYPDSNVGQNAEYGTCAQSGVSAPRGFLLLGALGLLGRRRRRTR